MCSRVLSPCRVAVMLWLVRSAGPARLCVNATIQQLAAPHTQLCCQQALLPRPYKAAVLHQLTAAPALMSDRQRMSHSMRDAGRGISCWMLCSASWGPW